MASTTADVRAAHARHAGNPAAQGSAPGGDDPSIQHASIQHVPHRWWSLGVIGLAQLMVVLDATILNIALPSAQRALNFDNDGRQWVITAYSLAFGSLLLLGGRLADLFGRRTTFVIGLIGFGGASALGGAAHSFTMLIVARALQGAFGALLAPSALSLLTTTFTDVKERSKAFGVFGAIAGSGSAIGLLLGGVLTEHLSWRWTLYVNDVIAVIAVIGAFVFLRGGRPAVRPKLDLLGTLLVGGGLFCLVFGFSRAETDAWSARSCWGFLIAAGVLLLLFLLWQMKSRNPLLPLRVLGDRNRAASFLSVFIAGSGMFGIFLFLTYYLQGTLHYSPVKTGLGFLPMVGALMISAQLATNLLIPRIGPKPVVPVGMGLAGGALIWLTQLDLSSGYTHHVLPPLLVLGVGLGLVFPPAISLATLGVGPRDAGVASATVNTMQQVGGSIGTALFNTLAATSATNYAKDHLRLPHLAAHAAVHSYATAYTWAAGFFAAGLLITVFLYRRGRPFARAAAAPETLPAAETAAETASPAEPAPAEGLPAAEGIPVAHADDYASTFAVIRGRVLTASGQPVERAAVTLIDPNGQQLGRATATQDGLYAVGTPGSGSYVLVGSAPGHQPQVTTLTMDEGPVDFDLVLEGTGGLSGTVTSAGSGAGGVLVVATDVYGEVADSAITDTDGFYSLAALVPGTYTVTVSGAGHQPTAQPVVVEGTTPTRYDAELVAAAELSGTVHNPEGKPLADASVTLLDGTGRVIARRITGDDGAYLFTDLGRGDYTLVASGFPPHSAAVKVGGEGSEGFDLALRHEGDEEGEGHPVR
jgi:EmrB/QacA subfamily drug resistance transporter